LTAITRAPDKAALALLDPDNSFPKRLRRDRAVLAKLLQALRGADGDTSVLLAAMETLAHRLAGAAGTFGYDAIGDAAMGLEDCLAEAEDTASDDFVDTVIGKAGDLDMAIGTAID
jgi:chemotaxis protein histidine kinase CheA